MGLSQPLQRFAGPEAGPERHPGSHRRWALTLQTATAAPPYASTSGRTDPNTMAGSG
jgi:hypothetical protein